jgi:predicted Holliday junction resolvase-like endonuclease
MNNLIYVIDELQAIYGFCPCCGEIFRLADAKLKFPSSISKDDPIFKVKLFESKVSKQQESLERYEEKMDAALVLARERAQSKGRKLAKKRLKSIDPIFSGRNIDSQDVKTIFDPVDFIVFDKMNSESGIIKGIEFIALEPKSKKRELVLNSIDKAIRRGDLDFKVIRVDKQGEIEVE